MAQAELVWQSELVTEPVGEMELLRLWIGRQLGPRRPEMWRPWVRLLEPLRGVSSARTGAPEPFEVPAGFVYDQASAPWFAVPIVSPTGRYLREASCLHDMRCPWGPVAHPARGETLTPLQAANELRAGMLAKGAARWRSNLVRWAVLNFGPGWEQA